MRTKILASLSALSLTLFLASCEKTQVDEMVVTEPVIESFSPTTGYAGQEVVVTGTQLNNVVKAAIAGIPATVSKRVSDTKVVILVPDVPKSGPIELTNAIGTGTSSTDFTVDYPEPLPDASTMTPQVELASNIIIFGQRMSVVNRVLFTAAGNPAHEAEIIEKADKELLVRVPYVEANQADITFEYYNGSALAIASKSLKVNVVRFEPAVSAISTTQALIGDVVTLTGQYLDKVEKVTMGGTACVIQAQAPDKLDFVVPELDTFVDGDNVTDLTITYFDGAEQTLLEPQFKVKVPAVLFWQDRTVWAQARQAQSLTSFFSPATGIAYQNGMWRQLDPMAYRYQAGTCRAPQTPAVLPAEYNSVDPYFFFYGSADGNLNLYSPAASSTTLKNFFWQDDPSNASRVTGNNANCYGTPVLTFMVLSKTVAAHSSLIDDLKTDYEQFNTGNYPLDVQNKKIGNIDISSAVSVLPSSTFAPAVFTPGTAKNATTDIYVLVLYYDHNGANAANPAANLLQAGVLNITGVKYQPYNGTDTPSASSVTFDMYWMKHQYGN